MIITFSDIQPQFKVRFLDTPDTIRGYITNPSVINSLLAFRPNPFVSTTALPSTAPKRERRKQARPGELLQAALTLFVEKGFAGTRVEEVAARAGVSKGTLFLYFPTKEDLFKALVQDTLVQSVNEGMAAVAQFEGSSAELLERLMLQWWERHGNTPASGIAKLIMSEARNFPDLAIYFRESVILPAHELIRSVLQRGIDRGEFVPMDTQLVLHSVMSPLIFLVMWRHSIAPVCPDPVLVQPLDFIRSHAQLLLRALSRSS